MMAKLTPEEYRKKWGIPDWRDEKAYPENRTFDGWRWEFLRRRDDYRRDWAKWAKQIKEFEAWNKSPQKTDWDKMDELSDKIRETFSRYGFNGLQPPEPKIQFPNVLFFRRDRADRGKPYRVLSPGLNIWSNPFEWTFRDDIRKRFALSHISPVVLSENHCAFVFDLSKDISPQIREATKDLLHEQRRRNVKVRSMRKHPEEWRTYLRALDLEVENPKIDMAEIYRLLKPNGRAKNPSDSGERLLNDSHTLQIRITQP